VEKLDEFQFRVKVQRLKQILNLILFSWHQVERWYDTRIMTWNVPNKIKKELNEKKEKEWEKKA